MSLRATMALSVAMLAGCVSVLPDGGPPPDIYRLSSPAVSAAGEEAAPWIVETPLPVAPEAYSTDRIAVSEDGVRIAYVAGARWSAPAPQLIQSLVMDSFNARGAVRAAVRPEDGVAARVELRLELRSFEAVYRDGSVRPPVAEIIIDAKLVDARTRALIATRRFSHSHDADGRNLDQIVAALDTAAHATAGAVVLWTVENSPAPPAEADA